MPTKHLVLCNGARHRAKRGQPALDLRTFGPRANIDVSVSDISKRMLTDVPPLLTDLIEVASLVFAADQATSRGTNHAEKIGSDWRRTFHFVVPVRCPAQWSREPVKQALASALEFLSEDQYEFSFERLLDPPPAERYMDLSDAGGTAFEADAVAMLSGGLDSLAGAALDLIERGQRLALVSHVSATKLSGRQRDLVRALSARCAGAGGRAFHVPVLVWKRGDMAKEHTQRTRSFLFAALGSVVARLFKTRELKFFENGVTSFNLPISAQAVGSRASRTTHPKSLSLLASFIGELLDEPFVVRNPFIWKTKADVVQVIVDQGCGDLIQRTVSCSRVRAMKMSEPHCGTCSQCIDRRFGILGADAAQYDPANGYCVELFTGARNEGVDRTMAESYVALANEVANTADDELIRRFPQLSRSLLYLGEGADQSALKACVLFHRHAETVCQVVDAAIGEHAAALRAHKLPPTSLLSLVVGTGLSETPRAGPLPTQPSGTPLVCRIANDGVWLNHVRVFNRNARSMVRTVETLARYACTGRDGRTPGGWLKTSEIGDRLRAQGNVGATDDLDSIGKYVRRVRRLMVSQYHRATGVKLDEQLLIETGESGRGYRLNPAVGVAFGEPVRTTSQLSGVRA